MNLNDKFNYINYILMNEEVSYNGPISLFKYRSFDEYTFDMLDNKYLFLCAAEKLDDPTECITSISIQNLYDLEKDGFKRQCVFEIIYLIRPYTSNENFEQIKRLITQILNKNGAIRPNQLLNIKPEIDKLAPGVNTATIINYLVNISKKLDDPEINEQIKILIIGAHEARQKIGICSLCENSDNEYMRKNYADKNSGYCVEYDFSNYKTPKILFPVIYQDERETNIVKSIMGNLVGQMVFGLSNHRIQPDISQYLRLFITKYKQWEYQNEWRILGNANSRITAPKIKKIIVGNNATKENMDAIKDYCNKKGIVLEERE